MSSKSESSDLKQNTVKSSKKKYIVLGSFIVVTCLAAVGWLNRDLIVRYYHYSKIHHFSQGDDIYITDNMLNDTSFKTISVYRLARPITEQDINESNIDDIKKSVIKQTLKPSGELKIISSDRVIILDSLRKNKTSLIGTFLGKEFIPITYKSQTGTILVYAVKLSSKNVAAGYHSEDKLPDNYIYADNKFYIAYWQATFK